MKLYSERLVLSLYTSLDFDAFCAIVRNDKVMKYISGKGDTDKVARVKFEDIIKKNTAAGKDFFYKVNLKDGTYIGFAKAVSSVEEGMEIGYAILPAFWRKGYVTEIIESLVEKCTTSFPDAMIMAIVDTQNIGSTKVLEKSNFVIYKRDLIKDNYCWFLKYMPQ